MTPAAFANPGRFFRGNLHTHSTRSDGKLAPEEVCRRYEAMGYDFICLSDHFLPDYGFPIVDTAQYRSNRFTTLLGAEVHAGEMKLGGHWHISVGLPADFGATADDETGQDLARRCRDAGAFVAIAHPQWYGLMPDEARAIEAAHAVEIYNHSCAMLSSRPDGTYLLDALLSDGVRLNAIATDDAHFRTEGDENRDAFGGWVMVKAESNTPDALLAALKAGAFYASTGPLIHDMAIEGNKLTIDCSPATIVMALGRGARSVEVPGTTLTRATLPIGSFKGDWLRVVVVDAAGNRAWSNPVWLD